MDVSAITSSAEAPHTSNGPAHPVAHPPAADFATLSAAAAQALAEAADPPAGPPPPAGSPAAPGSAPWVERVATATLPLSIKYAPSNAPADALRAVGFDGVA